MMEIKRKIFKELLEWKFSSKRKPGLITGARQIGKSWVMEEFGKRCYEHWVKFDFDEMPDLAEVFRTTKDPERLIPQLALYTDVPILPEKTLIIFDELQDCEEALNALKYFNEKAPEYHILAAGSLLGVAVKKKKMKVPVGQVDIFKMYPIAFDEFLRAADERMWEYIEHLDSIKTLPAIVFNRLNEAYRRYRVCGGMPEAVVAMLQDEGMREVDKVLSSILALYEIDFAKYAEPQEITRIKALWHSLPSQLSRENRKFVYNVVKRGARSKDYEDALTWLEDAGLIYMIYDVSKPGLPLSAYAELGAFKVYACDIGILRRLSNLDSAALMRPVEGFVEFKGALAENAVLQSIMANTELSKPYYWTSGNKAEIDFLIEHGVDIIPVEVKAENVVSGRSIAIYDAKYHPAKRVRTSLQNLHYAGNLLSCPTPLVDWLPRLLTIT